MSAPYRITNPKAGLKKVDDARTGEGFKSYLDRLMKLIPAEVVGLYLIGSGFIPPEKREATVLWTVVCLIAVVVVKSYGTADPTKHEPPDWIHVGISCVSFIIWVYTIGGPFAAYRLAVPWVGSLLVLAWTFFIPRLYHGASS
jgi:hypothetical protein